MNSGVVFSSNLSLIIALRRVSFVISMIFVVVALAFMMISCFAEEEEEDLLVEEALAILD
jgi:protein-S-isoprenylcysteine O-methyltransferase Ste14